VAKMGLMIEHGASIKIIENICTIRINANYPYNQMIEGVLRDLRAAILSQQYSNFSIDLGMIRAPACAARSGWKTIRIGYLDSSTEAVYVIEVSN
jgi:hypothetical protein